MGSSVCKAIPLFDLGKPPNPLQPPPLNPPRTHRDQRAFTNGRGRGRGSWLVRALGGSAVPASYSNGGDATATASSRVPSRADSHAAKRFGRGSPDSLLRAVDLGATQRAATHASFGDAQFLQRQPAVGRVCPMGGGSIQTVSYDVRPGSIAPDRLVYHRKDGSVPLWAPPQALHRRMEREKEGAVKRLHGL
ncbi:hypothetical protein CCMA1212_006395 [Trichoderma ghanense]|uniref:Uncharacterized protein n=1 Tax=Trichoderma ghanense TaxID=65468 RepID=A0ABY2H0D5_9HYPO